MSGIPRSNKFWEEIKFLIGTFHMILLCLLRDLNVTLFQFYWIHLCFSTFWIFKGYCSQVITTPLEMETCSMKQKYMLSICMCFEQVLSYFPVSYSSANIVAESSPRGFNLNSASAFQRLLLPPFHLLHALIPLCLPFQKHLVCFLTFLSSA